MTVCLTGDVHHMSMETRDQAYMDGTEVEAAIAYAEIAAEHDVPVTLFLTGKCAVEEPERVRRLAAMDHVEIGGHNYWAFTTPVHKGWRALAKLTGGRAGSWNGPQPFQSWEIRKTIAALEKFGVDVTAWRDHAYRHDRNTARLLRNHGITHFSDENDPSGRVRRESGLTVAPVNTPPDHEHVYHAFLTREFDAERDFDGPFGTDAYPVDEWVDHVLAARDDLSDCATVLAHPACMRLADGFEGFRDLCRRLDDAIPMREL